MAKTRITSHAKMRMKHRGVSKRADGGRRTAINAYTNGLRQLEATGSVLKFINSVYARCRERKLSNPTIRLYGEHVYIFSGRTLVTVYKFPDDIREEALDQCRKKKRGMIPCIPC